MQNTLNDLNNHLFAQLERLNDEDLVNEDLEKEMKRASAIVDVASAIIDNANTVIKAVQLKDKGFINATTKLPQMLVE